MSATDVVVEHIRGSLLDLRRRLDSETVADIARAVMLGADQALRALDDAPELEDPESADLTDLPPLLSRRH